MHATVLAALRPFGDVADVRLEWGPRARLWFTEVTPRAPGAAALAVAVEDRDRLLVTVGATTGEIGGLSRPLEWLTTLATAVFAGRSLEAGRSGQHARVLCEDGSVVTLRRGLPWPGMWRSATHHEPYGPRATDQLRALGRSFATDPARSTRTRTSTSSRRTSSGPTSPTASTPTR